MRLILDTNLWSSLGDDGSLPEFDRLLSRLDMMVMVPPSTLLEVSDIPHEQVRNRIIRALATGRRRTRLRTEADSYAEELVQLIRRTHPEWLFQIPRPALLARHRNFWLKKVWAEALADSTRIHRYQRDQKSVAGHMLQRQKSGRRELLAAGFKLGPLTELLGRLDDDGLTGLPGWDGTEVVFWRLSLAQLTWFQLGIVGPRAARTGEDRTMTDWVEPYVDLRCLRAAATEFVQMWFHEAEPQEVPRNWITWAVDTVQMTQKVGSGNPADAQHASYLLDCDLFLSADVRFVEALERVREDAPFSFASSLVVSGDRSVLTAQRIADAIQRGQPN